MAPTLRRGDPDRRAVNTPSRLSAGAFVHGGADGTSRWVDPELDLGCAYLSVARHGELGSPMRWNRDLFGNLVAVAVVD